MVVIMVVIIPSAGGLRPTVIDKSQPIELGLKRTSNTNFLIFCARPNLCRTLPAEGIVVIIVVIIVV